MFFPITENIFFCLFHRGLFFNNYKLLGIVIYEVKGKRSSKETPKKFIRNNVEVKLARRMQSSRELLGGAIAR